MLLVQNSFIYKNNKKQVVYYIIFIFISRKQKRKIPQGPIFLFQQMKNDLKILHAYKISVHFAFFQMQRITRKTSKSNKTFRKQKR